MVGTQQVQETNNMQRMEIGDVRPQDLNDQPQKQSPNDTTPAAQGLDQDN
jgi:hypothetical protein